MANYSFYMGMDGKLPMGMKQTLAYVLPAYAGQKVSLSISPAKEKRSLDQNDYYRGYVLTHVRRVRLENGDAVTLDAAHEDLLEEFAPRVEGVTLKGKQYSRAKRTHEMSAPEMSEFITAITARMAEFGEPIPMYEGKRG